MREIHETPLVHSNERMHEMSVECWCYPETGYIRGGAFDGSVLVLHRERAIRSGQHLEENRTREQEKSESYVFGPRL